MVITAAKALKHMQISCTAPDIDSTGIMGIMATVLWLTDKRWLLVRAALCAVISSAQT
jgi:hypothetical protein